MILHLYLARRFLYTFSAIFILIAGIVYLITTVENMRTLTDGNAGAGTVMLLTILVVPQLMHMSIPLVTALATITLFINLSRTSELVVSRAAGRSAMRSLRAPVIIAFILGIVAVAILNPIAADSSRVYEQRKNALRSGSNSTLSVSDEGLWLRQGDENGQTVIRAAHADLQGTRFSRVTFLGISPQGHPLYRIEAESAQLVPGAWRMKGAKVWTLEATANPERGAETHDTYELPSTLTRSQIIDSFGTPSVISFWDLPHFIAQLEAAGFSALNHRAWFQSQLALPLTMVAMVMIGAAFSLRHTRMGRTGLMILLAVLCSFALSFLGNFARILAENGEIPVLIGAWAPPIAGILLPLSLLLHLEDG